MTKLGQWLPGDSPLLGACFRDAGYRCGYVGKWDLGNVAKPGPQRFGFDDGWAAWTNSAHDYWKGDYFVGQRSIVPSDGRFRPVIETDFALEFIRRADARPFFLVLSWGPPHFPGTPPEEYLRDGPMPLRPNTPPERAERTANWTLPRYYGLIESLDAEFGRLMGELDALGLAEETIVVYASDHGAMMGSHGYMGKELPFSESAQVPWLLRWPGHVPAGSTPATPFGTTDILPTLAGLAGIAKPVGVDGVDLSGVLLGRPEATTQQAVYIAAHEPADLPAPGWRGVRTERHLFARTEAGPWLLYDVREDPYELRNLVDEAPPTLEALDALTLELMRRYGDTWST
jgi:arylsulfatase A-like enzyme